MNIGIGNLLLALGALKAVVGFGVYREAFSAMATGGVWATVTDQSLGAAALWFVFAAGLFVVLGLCVREIERLGGTPPAAVGWGLAVVATFAVTLMPENGAWLMYPIAALTVARARETVPHSAVERGRRGD